MSFSRRQLVQVAATSAAAGLAGCSGLFGRGPDNQSGDIEAEASVNGSLSRQAGTPQVIVVWTANNVADYLTVDVENVSTGNSVRTAICGVGATVQYDGAKGATGTNGPVGSAPDCESGEPEGLSFSRGDTVNAVVTAHAGDATKELVSKELTFPTPTPTPGGQG
jgi:hypothetical protein